MTEILHERRRSGAWFPSYGLLPSKETMQSIHLESPCRYFGDRLLGPYCLPPRLNGAVYHDFLRNFLPELLQDVDLQTRIHLWFKHDGAPQHFIVAFRKFLNNVFPD
ncbi:hypothetical protein Cfor_05350 [Coptotermes formosanus]|uniref:Uncharacterized protein n=1 Tax=Coptotermes formosanus TaxID=36987 RepID=A0A6L2Q7E6_COPFO|nr:hypothetical protein Cfor_05350 [Coptotermes formosanus]